MDGEQGKSVPQNIDGENKQFDRRRFIKNIATALPAVGLACAIPTIGNAFGKGGKNSSKNATWFCITEVIAQGKGWASYLLVNCTTDEGMVIIDDPGLALGSCEFPAQGGCWLEDAVTKWEPNETGLTVVYGPNLTAKGKENFRKFQTMVV